MEARAIQGSEVPRRDSPELDIVDAPAAPHACCGCTDCERHETEQDVDASGTRGARVTTRALPSCDQWFTPINAKSGLVGAFRKILGVVREWSVISDLVCHDLRLVHLRVIE